jgi:hypothetical protein
LIVSSSIHFARSRLRHQSGSRLRAVQGLAAAGDCRYGVMPINHADTIPEPFLASRCAASAVNLGPPMNDPDNPTNTSSPVCENCGREADTVIDGKGWCVDCFHARGSCCAGEFDRTEDPD